MKIAIIDSGVDVHHKRLQNANVFGVSINIRNNQVYVEDGQIYDNLGHGTAITSIIHKIAPDAEIVCVKIFFESLTCSENIFIEALRWCINQQVNLINISLGIVTNNPHPDMFTLCRKAYERNIYIVSACFHQLNVNCYPAFFPEVFAVTSGNVIKSLDYGYIPNSSIEFVAKGSMQRVADLNNGFKIVEGTSYACAHFTGIVYQILQSLTCKPTSSQLKTILIEKANSDVKPVHIAKNKVNHHIIRYDLQNVIAPFLDIQEKFNWLGRLAVFPVSEKEMKLFSTFPDLSLFSIQTFIDYPKTHSMLEIDKHKSFLTDDDFEQFDSIILGYFYEHPFQSNIKYGYDLIKQCIQKDKNFFVFDNHLKIRIDQVISKNVMHNKCYVPKVDQNMFDAFSNFRFYPSINTPILAVIGTTNKQGKFTTQLRIKNILQKKSYKVSHVSTEPHGEIFGAEFSFPYGYNSTVDIDYRRWPEFLRNLTKAMEYYHNPDIIITGTQSWFAPPSFNRPPNGEEFDSLHFLFGIQPDAVICAINPTDSIELINRTLDALKIVSHAKTLFFVITPWVRNFTKNNGKEIMDTYCLDDQELHSKIDFYQSELQTPVLNIMDFKNDDLIINFIENFYSNETK